MNTGFLPITKEELISQGIQRPDFVYVIGDAYVDHPSFGHAIISRVLHAQHRPIWGAETRLFGDSGKYGLYGQPLFGLQKKTQNGRVFSGRKDGDASGLRYGGVLQSDPQKI